MLRTERGFTFVELIVAMVITSIVMGAFGSTLYHFLIMPALQGDHLTAVNELRFALDVIQADGVQAQSFTSTEAPDYGYFSLDYYDLDSATIVTHNVTYSYDNEAGRLIREQSLDGMSTSIASHIADAGDVFFIVNEAGNAVTVTITVTIASGRGTSVTETSTRTIEMRLGL